VDAAWLNTNIADTAGFLAYPPALRVRLSATGTLVGPAFPASTAAGLDTVTFDNWGGWSSANGWYTVPVSGVYYCYAQVSYGTQSGPGQTAAGFALNGATASPVWGKCTRGIANATGTTVAAAKRLRLAAGSTVSMAVATSGFTIDINGGGGTRLIIVWESA
jgi:hypothetical protein